MRNPFKSIKDIGLMTKIFLVMFFSISAITSLITLSTYKMSENLFIETFSITNAKVLKQIKTQIEEFNYSIVNAVNDLEQSPTVMNYLMKTDKTHLEMINSYYDMRFKIEDISRHLDGYDTGITVAGKNVQSFSTNRVYWPISEDLLERHSITKSSLQNPKRLIYHYDTFQVDNMEKSAIVASRALIDRKNEDVYGVLYITMQEPQFQQFYASYTSEGNDVVLINGDGIIVSSNQAELIGQKELELFKVAKEIEARGLSYKSIGFFDREKIVLAEYLSALDLYVVNLIDQKIVVDNIINKKSIVLISLLIIAIATLFIYLISRRLTKSLTHLVFQINNSAKDRFNYYIDVPGSYETRQVATAFNTMLDELREYVDELMITQEKQRHAELTALQQQINPHFLYNTLASIKIIAAQGDIEKATKLINKLISLLQNTIGHMSETNTVEQEISNMKDYVYINQARYGSQIRVNFFVTPESLTYELPKLMIQPFIENAFFHAFNKKTSGFIHIMIGTQGDTLICEIVDNGDGMVIPSGKRLPTRQRNEQLRSGIGVRNVHERIEIMYGKAYGVEFSSSLGEGTKVKIRLPIIKSNL
ncbi:sensor histidine kinase [Sporosarcina pasteurii]|uniref:Probable sensor-like histidine kinase YehU n=2 Tax=Sporosarcina pasteurii TaxID=1474 RepID=A0A380BDF5_SPOPA|nr:sensor histidine kinase [Sporosarcina pasteurii]SUI99565.1 Probable sensor-like histidine kinase YehU [Sporosarcina pasteurii]